MTVIAVIHQPRYSIFALFDHLLLLGKGGMTVFSGPTLVAETYFESIGFKCPPTENVADFLMDVCAGIIPRQDDDEFVRKNCLTYGIPMGAGAWISLARNKLMLRELQSTTAQNKSVKWKKKLFRQPSCKHTPRDAQPSCTLRANIFCKAMIWSMFSIFVDSLPILSGSLRGH